MPALVSRPGVGESCATAGGGEYQVRPSGSACGSEPIGEPGPITELPVRTVQGSVSAQAIGLTLMHEHLWMDSRPLLAVHGYQGDQQVPWDERVATEARWNPGAHPANYVLTDLETVIDELGPFIAAGGRTIVDVTPPALGRDPLALRAISRRTGINVVMGTGHYLEPIHEPWVTDGVGAVADHIVGEVSDGVGDTGIRPGIIGEIGTSNPLHERERVVLRGVASASRSTDLAISVHVHPWGHEAPAVLDELEAAGADPGRVVLGHVTTASNEPRYLQGLAERGAVLGFDLFGFDHSLLGVGRWPTSDLDAVEAIARLADAGYLDQIVISQDIGVRTRLRRWGGWGYAHLLEHVLPLMRGHGFGDADFARLLVATPARLLAGVRT